MGKGHQGKKQVAENYGRGAWAILGKAHQLKEVLGKEVQRSRIKSCRSQIVTQAESGEGNLEISPQGSSQGAIGKRNNSSRKLSRRTVVLDRRAIEVMEQHGVVHGGTLGHIYR
jgi:hypothetical protein